MSISTKSLLLLANLVTTSWALDLGGKVIAAVNCGGRETRGAYGIHYSADYLTDGIASDHGQQFTFRNGHSDDLEIYQSERWSSESFQYEVPASDGEYVIILKFSEVYFNQADAKVFNVRINSYTAIKNLDIFSAAGGRGFAHDIYVPVVIKEGKIAIQGHERPYKGKIVIEFAKGPLDNPKVNGFAVVLGKVSEMPTAPERYSTEGPLGEDFNIYEEPSEDTFRPQILRNDDEDEEQEMFSAASDGENNPFEESNHQETNAWWMPIVALLIIIIPVCYIIHIRQQRLA